MHHHVLGSVTYFTQTFQFSISFFHIVQISEFLSTFFVYKIIPQLSVIIFISPNLLTGIFRVSGSSDLPRPVQTVFFLFRQVTAVAKDCQLA